MPEQKKPGPGRPRSRTTPTTRDSRAVKSRYSPGARHGKPLRPAPKPADPEANQPDPAKPVAPPTFDKPEFVVIATIAAPFGLRGAVKANIQTDFPDRFDQLKEVFLSQPGPAATTERKPYTLLSARPQNEKQVVLRFTEITKVEQAEALRGYSVSIPVTDVVPLPEGEYYIFQIIGLEVYSTDGRYIGRVVNVERLPANDIYAIRGPLAKQDVLIPAVKDIVKEIDLDSNRMTIELLEGLLPEG